MRQRHPWLKPELCLALRALHVHMHPRLFPGKEIKPQVAMAEHRGAHVVNPTRDSAARHPAPTRSHPRKDPGPSRSRAPGSSCASARILQCGRAGPLCAVALLRPRASGPWISGHPPTGLIRCRVPSQRAQTTGNDREPWACTRGLRTTSGRQSRVARGQAIQSTQDLPRAARLPGHWQASPCRRSCTHSTAPGSIPAYR